MEAAYKAAAARASKNRNWLGYSAAVLSGIVGGSVFTTIFKQDLPVLLRVLLVFLSLAAAALTTFQTRSDFAEAYVTELMTRFASHKKEISPTCPAPFLLSRQLGE
jgi:hypothetical protein